jgi:hypothetical protein
MDGTNGEPSHMAVMKMNRILQEQFREQRPVNRLHPNLFRRLEFKRAFAVVTFATLLLNVLESNQPTLILRQLSIVDWENVAHFTFILE